MYQLILHGSPQQQQQPTPIMSKKLFPPQQQQQEAQEMIQHHHQQNHDGGAASQQNHRNGATVPQHEEQQQPQRTTTNDSNDEKSGHIEERVQTSRKSSRENHHHHPDQTKHATTTTTTSEEDQKPLFPTDSSSTANTTTSTTAAAATKKDKDRKRSKKKRKKKKSSRHHHDRSTTKALDPDGDLLVAPSLHVTMLQQEDEESWTDDNDDDDETICEKTADILSLDSIRNSLIRQEETIIFALIERAQYRRNSICYRPGGFGTALGTPPGSRALVLEVDHSNDDDDKTTDDDDDDDELSFLEYFLVGTEVLHCSVRRYTSPEEHAFFPERLPEAGPMKALPQLDYPTELLSSVGGANGVNINKRLLQVYQTTIVPSLCRKGDDEQHGSTVLADIAVLQALSRRIHYGKFVAESKYLSHPQAYQDLVDSQNPEGVLQLLTNTLVEAQVLRRARLKATTYGTEPTIINEHDNDIGLVAAAAASAVAAAMESVRLGKEAMDSGDGSGSGGSDSDSDTIHNNNSDHVQQLQQGRLKGKVDPLVIESLYRDIIIPMTKDVEVAYLFRRCGKMPPPPYDI
mmetsp:Transcript_2051/g.5690  ORF Transcript_2051/g.5690 Transcript_2051/m.5690 type:complete len:574 (-) Transcript_2051:126-1847(-)